MFEHFAMLDSRLPAGSQVDPGFCVVQGRLQDHGMAKSGGCGDEMMICDNNRA